MRQVFAVIVTYLPDLYALNELLASMMSQVGHIVVVDNTPIDDQRVALLIGGLAFSQIELLRLGSNQGIAKALNIGIQHAIHAGAKYVLLSDQDSLPDPSMVAKLYEVSEELIAVGARVGCVSPEYFDRTTGQSFPFQVQVSGKYFYTNAGGEQAKPWVEMLSGITSGMLIQSTVFADVGMMREDFFIDYVDTEWCHRARSKGYVLYGTAQARLNHRLGDSCFKVWVFGWRSYNAYSSVRLYYRFRNFVLLMQLGHVSRRWKIRACWYWLGNLYAYSLFSPDRLRNIGMIIRGLRDGLRGSTGPLK